jgi:Domain of unknown function (DUF4166)
VRGRGVFRVAHGETAAARLTARLLRLPSPGDAVETTLVVTESGHGVEHWLRRFGGRTFDSRQYPDGPGGFRERFGVIEFRFRRDASNGACVYAHTGTACVAGPIRIPLPRACGPRITAREDVMGPAHRRITVRVEVPVLGTLLAYDGTIVLEESGA